MKLALVVLACLGTVGACKRTTPPQAAAGSSSVPGDATGSASQASAHVQATLLEFFAYSESVIAIMREHGKDCDQAAKQLESRVPVFLELGPRMVKAKVELKSLPEQERAGIMRTAEQATEGFKARNPDADALEETAKACEKSSPAFAAILPKVMLVKKK